MFQPVINPKYNEKLEELRKELDAAGKKCKEFRDTHKVHRPIGVAFEH